MLSFIAGAWLASMVAFFIFAGVWYLLEYLTDERRNDRW